MAEPLRVAWFGHAEGRRADGLSTYSRELVCKLQDRGAAVRFHHFDIDGDVVPSADSVSLRAWRGKTVTIPAPRTLAQIDASLRDFRPQIAHFSWSFAIDDGRIARLCRDRGAATVATFHLPHGPKHSVRGFVLQQLYRWHRRHMASVQACIALSEQQRGLLAAAGYPAQRIVVIPNAVDTRRFTPGESGLRERLGAAFVVAAMGRLDPEKRPLQLIDAFVKLGWPDDHLLVLAGDGSLRGRVEQQARDHLNVRPLGMLAGDDERLELLRGCDIFVLPSTAEGLALSLLEAMAAGCAIVATDAGQDGPALEDAGLVIPTHPLQPDLSAALNRLRDDPALRHRLGEAARRRAVLRFGLDAHTDSVLRVYARLIGPEAVAPLLRGARQPEPRPAR